MTHREAHIREFVGNIRILCVAYKSQENVARVLGVSRDCVHRWFRGKNLPSFENYLRVVQEVERILEEAEDEESAHQ